MTAQVGEEASDGSLCFMCLRPDLREHPTDKRANPAEYLMGFCAKCGEDPTYPLGNGSPVGNGRYHDSDHSRDPQDNPHHQEHRRKDHSYRYTQGSENGTKGHEETHNKTNTRRDG